MDTCGIRYLLVRSSGIESTAESFKSWDTCMDNNACKIIAIVGISLASIIVLWLVGALLTCIRVGITGISQFCCWCCNCNSNKNDHYPPPVNENYMNNRPYMPPSTVIYQPIQQPQSAYYGNPKDEYYDEAAKSNDVYELEQDFDLEKQKEKVVSRKGTGTGVGNNRPKKLLPVVYDTEPDNRYLINPQEFTSRDSFLNNSNPANQYRDNNMSSDNYHSPIRRSDATNYYNFGGSNYNHSPTRAPYPEDDIGTYPQHNYQYDGRY